MSRDILIFISLFYTGFLFLIAYYADRAARKTTRPFWFGSPVIYTLSLSVYCTAWTFYGAVGSAARSGLEFLAIYIGPSLMFFGFWMILRRIVRIGHQQNINSVADFLSSRYGKSNFIAVIATVLIVITTMPYIALQLQSIAQSYAVFFAAEEGAPSVNAVAFMASVVLGVFAILFGTRHAKVNERHHGVVLAIAVESIVKLAAILIVGGVLIYQFGGLGAVFATPQADEIVSRPIFSSNWFALVSLSFMAVVVLPRMFHVMVVENENEDDIFTASWAFPLYLLALNIFVLPVAIIGLVLLGSESNPDYFLISIPLSQGNNGLAYLSFIGGLSAATSMIIVSAIAVATMISNHIAMPVWLDARGIQSNPDDVSRALLFIRRVSIAVIMLLGYIYFEAAGGNRSLATIGLIAFVGVAQLFPSLVAGLYWRGANKTGAGIAILLGALLWLYTLFLPSFSDVIITANVIENGPFGIAWLRPYALMGIQIESPVVHALFWSMIVNVSALFFGSILRLTDGIGRLQANQFVDAMHPNRGVATPRWDSELRLEDYFLLAQRVLGREETEVVFLRIAEAQGRDSDMPIVNDYFVDHLERAMGGILGGAAAHTLISQLAGEVSIPASETIKLADETVQNIEYARVLEAQSKELEATAQALREANASLLALDAQKDAFLSQVSHELRTPMTAIRSFTDILIEDQNLDTQQRRNLLEIIANENKRLTGLLDELIDLSYLESGQVRMSSEPFDLRDIIERALQATEPIWREAGLDVFYERPAEPMMTLCDFNRVSQIFINLITNAAKYVRNDAPQLRIECHGRRKIWFVDFVDNGPGVAVVDRESIFEKFSRGGASEIAGSAGLGLAISREIAENLNGSLELMPSVEGSTFRLSLPKY